MKPADRDRLEARAGTSVARINASGVKLAAALGCDPSLVSQWKSGSGPVARVHEVIQAWEKAGHDCTSILAGFIDTQMEARGVLAACPKQLAREETQIDSEEDAAQVAYLTGQPGALVAWRDSLVRYVAFASRALRSLEVAK